MKKQLIASLTFCLTASILLAGCGKKEEAVDQTKNAATTTKVGQPAQQGGQVGLDPNYKGPTDGAYGTRGNR